MWLAAALLSALFAGLTTVLAKCGIKKTDSDVATAIRTGAVLLLAWAVAFAAGSAGDALHISGRSLLFLTLSGLATGASWICYFKALSVGEVNKVAAVDKSSTVLTMLAAILIFKEYNHLAVKLVCTAAVAAGVCLMAERKPALKEGGSGGRSWFVYAVLSAVFAALTSILAKVGISDVESNLATAIRTGVVLLLAWGIVFAKGKQKQARQVDRKELVFILLSGVATGASWLCYYYAVKHGVLSVVTPIDKLSIVVTVTFSYFAFKERLSAKALLGLLLMAGGAVAMAVFA